MIIGKVENSRWILLQPVDEHDEELLPREAACLREMCPEASFSITAVRADWFTDLCPWSAPSAFRGQPDFGSGGEAFLKRLLEEEIPALREQARPEARFVLGGYSLAGLFALWAGYRTDVFSGIAAASPSVWYPGWIEYAEKRRIRTPAVYLSLGDREERTKNPVMRRVGDCIRKQRELLGEQKIQTTLVWNPGNHFAESEKRTAAGFAWILKA